MNNYPAQIILLRHAEKPSQGPELSQEGFRRAHALTLLFSTNETILKFGIPVAIYAAAPHRPGSSIRSIQTMIPLATSLNLKLNQQFTKAQSREMVKNVLENPMHIGATVVICWSHEGLPEIAKFFGVIDAPSKWNSAVFNRFWVLRSDGTQVKVFMDLPQLLLPEDHI